MNPDALLLSYRNRGILLDSNLLLLFVVGLIDPSLVPKFKRTKMYTESDHKLLKGLVEQFPTLITTPHVLTEVSNLGRQLKGRDHEKFGEAFARSVTVLAEQFLPSIDVAQTSEQHRFGLTDAAIVKLCRGSHLLLTDDLKLANYLTSKGGDAVNFNHVREMAAPLTNRRRRSTVHS